ncbi:MAG TPA: hypothetical protein VFN68_15625 [Acidimicrobiales bacterium]|nr:hypothetical protein [Acidimicrobiales bacterium]
MPCSPRRSSGRPRPVLSAASLLVAAGLIVTACSSGAPAAKRAPGSSPAQKAVAASPATTSTTDPQLPAAFSTPLDGPHLAPGSDPSALPGPILIADRTNNRLLVVNPQGQIVWQFPRPGDLAPGQTFKIPDDAFFTPDGKYIIATEEDDFVISVIDVATGKIVYRYGHPGLSGAAPDYLWNPDDALMLPDGYILSADIKNCRLLLIGPDSHTPARIYGTTTNSCYHSPPARFGSPNGAFPMANGHYLVTEINGDWVDEMGINGQIFDSFHPPGLSYPSDSNEVSPGVYVSVSYSDPGVLETFNGQGQLLWRYKPLPGDPQLNQPSLAMPLPNGDFLMNDDYNHRVVVIDPRTDKVVWQYGHTGVAGSAPGYLDKPDGVDLAPPYSLLIRHAPTMGQPSGAGQTATATPTTTTQPAG